MILALLFAFVLAFAARGCFDVAKRGGEYYDYLGVVLIFCAVFCGTLYLMALIDLIK